MELLYCESALMRIIVCNKPDLYRIRYLKMCALLTFNRKTSATLKCLGKRHLSIFTMRNVIVTFL